MKQIIITFIAWTTIVLSVSATGQEGEQLFWKGANYQYPSASTNKKP